MKRSIALLLLVVNVAGLMAACAAPTPEVVEKEVVVEKLVVETVVVEKEKVVEKPVVETVVVERVIEKEVVVTVTPQVLRVRTASEFTGADPAHIYATENELIARQIFSGLLMYDIDTLELVPDLAKSWEISPDGLVYTFHLRSGVKWHKGYGELTAEDVKYSYERVLDQATGSRYAITMDVISKIEAPDPLTVVFTLKRPQSNFLHLVANYHQGSVVPREAVEELGDRFATSPIGSGPFVFERMEPGRIVLVANPDYFRGRPKLDRVEVLAIKEESSAEIALLRGEIDLFTNLNDPDIIERLRESADVTVDEVAAYQLQLMFLNPVLCEPCGNRQVRHAMMHALDRESIVYDFFKGTKLYTNSFIPSAFVEYTEDVPTYPYDPEKAKKLLAEAGYADGFDLELAVAAMLPQTEVGQIIVDNWNAIGIRATLKPMERAAYGESRAAGECQANFAGALLPPDISTPLMMFLHSGSSPPGLNLMRYAEVDDLLEKALQEVDEAKRVELYHQIQRQAVEDLAVFGLYENVMLTGVRTEVKDYVGDGARRPWLYGVWLEK